MPGIYAVLHFVLDPPLERGGGGGGSGVPNPVHPRQNSELNGTHRNLHAAESFLSLTSAACLLLGSKVYA